MATVIILTASPGTLQNWPVPLDWNNSNNQVEVIAGGASGAATFANNAATGGGGGAYSIQTNITLTPGGTAQYEIGSGGTAVSVSSPAGASAGNAGGDTWFNGATLGASSVGAKGGGAGQVGSDTVSVAGGTGGAAASGVGATKNSGGNGGNYTRSGVANTAGTGGGGAAGPNGNGNNGVTITSNGTPSSSAGGSGDAGSGGTAGTSGGGAGGNGTEFDSSHGSGGGGGGNILSATASAGSGGNYGAGGGGMAGTNLAAATHTSGAGIQGLIVITYTPSVTVVSFSQITDLPIRYGRASVASLAQFSQWVPSGNVRISISGRLQALSTARAVNNMSLNAKLVSMGKLPSSASFLLQAQALLKSISQGRTTTSVPFLAITARLQSVSMTKSLPSIRHFVTISPTVRAYAIGIDRNGSTVYWFYDTATGLPAVDSDGKPLNPF